MADDKKNIATKNDQRLSAANDQLGENNGESSCGCGGSRAGSPDDTTNKKTCK